MTDSEKAMAEINTILASLERDFENFEFKIPFWLDCMYILSHAFFAVSAVAFFLEHQHAKAGALFFTGILISYVSKQIKIQMIWSSFCDSRKRVVGFHSTEI
jgi:hypothetical protein